MMEQGFIIAAYGLSLIILLIVIALLFLTYRKYTRALQKLPEHAEEVITLQKKNSKKENNKSL